MNWSHLEAWGLLFASFSFLSTMGSKIVEMEKHRRDREADDERVREIVQEELDSRK